MMLYKNTKIKVRSPGGDTDFFDIVADVLQGDIFVPYLFIICLDYVLRTSIDLMKENGLTLEKAISRRYSARTITDDVALLVNVITQAESLMHNLERTVDGIGLHVIADKTEYICFDQSDDISTLHGGSLKQEDKFTYLGSSVSYTENNINTQQAKIWTAIDRLSVIWKSDLSDKINLFPVAVKSILLYGCTT